MCINGLTLYHVYWVIQEERSIMWEEIISVIEREKKLI
jgi:hypothetical protein